MGQRVWEEVDEGAAGADYGWNAREGRCATNSTSSCGTPPSGMTNPIHAYGHGDGCVSITGGAFVPRGAFGSASSYDGTYLYGDYGCGRIFRLTRSSSGTWSPNSFVTGMGEGGPIA